MLYILRYYCLLNYEQYLIEKEKKRRTIITIIIRKKYFEKKRENLLIMQLVIHSDRWDVMNVIGATSISSQNAFDASLKNLAQIKAELNMKMSKIEKLYELKEKNPSKMISWTIMTKFFNLMKHATRHECANVMKTANEYFKK